MPRSGLCADDQRMNPIAWTDWLTPSLFRIRVAPHAAQELCQQSEEVQELIRLMLTEIAELANVMPPETSRAWGTDGQKHLLQLRLGRLSLRYSINEHTRTLGVEHVIAPPPTSTAPRNGS
jgi:hypothetical protein